MPIFAAGKGGGKDAYPLPVSRDMKVGLSGRPQFLSVMLA